MLDASIFGGGTGEGGDHDQASSLEIGLTVNAHAHKFDVAAQLRFRFCDLLWREEKRMFIAQLLDHRGHFIIERLRIQPCLDLGLVSRFDLIPVFPVVVRVNVYRLDHISKFSEDAVVVLPVKPRRSGRLVWLARPVWWNGRERYGCTFGWDVGRLKLRCRGGRRLSQFA